MLRRICALLILLLGLAGPACAQTIDDPAFGVTTVVTGLTQPTTMAFLGADDFLVLEKGTGRVRRVLGGVLQPTPVLDVAVNSAGERGLLGIAINGETPPRVFLYYTEGEDLSGTGVDDGVPLGNRVYRYTWNPGAGVLEGAVLLLDLPTSPPTAHNGGVLALGPAPLPGPGQIGDGRILYAVIGDLGFQGQLQNFASGPPPNDAAVVFAIQQDGSPAAGNPFTPYCRVTTTLTCASDGECPSGEACETRVARYLAYGIRNSFGLAIDPVTQRLWETENGPVFFDEINLITPGMNGGWARIVGPLVRDAQGTVDLFAMPGFGLAYDDPEFSWARPIAPTAILFPVGSVLGSAYDAVALVADNNNGQLYRLPLNASRDGFDFAAFPALQDLVADGNDGVERDLLRFGRGFGPVTDLELGPDGGVYAVRIATGAVARIGIAPPPTPTMTRTPTPTATPLACAASPEPCRTPAGAGRSYLRLQHDPSGRRSVLVWQWLRGAATTLADFGHPEAGDDYQLCLYDGNGLIVEASVPAAGRCHGVPCWRVGPRGIDYRNRDALPDGLRVLSLRPGADQRARVVVRGQGSALAVPALAGLASPLTVQLKRATGPCFGAQYGFPPALRSDGTTFRDRAD